MVVRQLLREDFPRCRLRKIRQLSESSVETERRKERASTDRRRFAHNSHLVHT